MSERVQVPAKIELEYYRRHESESEAPEMWLVDPDFTNELRITVYSDDDGSYGIPPELLKLGRLQVELEGSRRALESFGKYLIALARLETQDTDVHDHFEDVQSGAGETLHMIVRRTGA
jgi:hypothetical protein